MIAGAVFAACKTGLVDYMVQRGMEGRAHDDVDWARVALFASFGLTCVLGADAPAAHFCSDGSPTPARAHTQVPRLCAVWHIRPVHDSPVAAPRRCVRAEAAAAAVDGRARAAGRGQASRVRHLRPQPVHLCVLVSPSFLAHPSTAAHPAAPPLPCSTSLLRVSVNLPPDFPCFYVMQAGVMSRGEPGWVRTGVTRWWRNFGDDWVSATAMWGTAGAVNFTVNPLWARVPFVALCSLVWSAILSAERGNVGTDEAGALPPSASANVDQAPASNDSDTERPTMVPVNLTAAHATAVVGMQDSEALVPDVEAALHCKPSRTPCRATRTVVLL